MATSGVPRPMTSDVVRLDKATLIPIGAVVGVVVTLMGTYGYLESRFDKLDRRLEKIEIRESDRWSVTQQKLWVERLRGSNPTLKIPEAE